MVGNKVNKSQLVDAVAVEADISKALTTKVIDSVLEQIIQQLKQGSMVSLVGFGTFGTKTRAARMGRHPKTQEPVQILEMCLPVFKPGKLLKEAAQAVKEQA